MHVYSAYLGKIPLDAKYDPTKRQYVLNSFHSKAKLEVRTLQNVQIDKRGFVNYRQLKLQEPISVDLNENGFWGEVNKFAMFHLNNISFELCTKHINVSPVYESRIKRYYPELLQPTSPSKKRLYSQIRIQCLRKLCCIDVHFLTMEYLTFLTCKPLCGKITRQKKFFNICNVPNLENAYYTGDYAVYGNGRFLFTPLVSIDIVGHELSHGFIRHTCNLTYKGLSGALNESYADIIGSMFENHMYTKYPNLPGCSDWVIGEDVCKGLRDMEHPEMYKQPSTMYGKYMINPHSELDHGGVHVNSGIINNVFFHVSEKVGIDVAFNWFVGTCKKLSKNASFFEFGNLLLKQSNQNKEVRHALEDAKIMN